MPSDLEAVGQAVELNELEEVEETLCMGVDERPKGVPLLIKEGEV